MPEPQEQDDKQYEPTQKKLEDARRKGDVPRSSDLGTAASIGGIVLVALGFGGNNLRHLGDTLEGVLSRADLFSIEVFSGGGTNFTGSLLLSISATLAPWLLVPAVFVLVTNVALRSFTVSGEKLKPKLSRVNPIQGAKNKFGRSGLFEFAKSFVKLVFFTIVLAIFLWDNLPAIIGTISLSPGMATVTFLQLSSRFLLLVLAIAIFVGGIDFLWQRQEFLRKNRMTRKEMTDESKENEGDPQMKQQRRQKGYEIAMQRMLADVPNADVIVVNPTHFSVALQWSREQGAAPVCVAKGVDEIAAKIREIAMENGVPIHSDPPTARAIYASVEVGEEIHPEQYRAVAAAIRFAENIRAKMQRRGP